jgi:enoyl-CoA hydratase/carnithine racemase
MPLTGPDILLYEKKDRIVTITLNRPERRNALNLELFERLAEAWVQFRDDEDAWVAIITGAGDKALCAGMDLIDLAEIKSKGEQLTDHTYLPFGDFLRLQEMVFCPEIWKPIICAINGTATAGGFCIAQNADIRIAAEHAELGIGETRWNLPAAWVCTLTRQLTLGHALEIALWGDRRITAQRGYEIGWINRVVPYEKLMDEAMEWAERMLSLAPRCVRNLKQILYRSHSLSPHEALAWGADLEQNLVGMEDTLEGPKAFTEKRKPEFKNR